jgi:signal transduction histidine kinase
LAQVISNLLSNAINFSNDDGQGIITITVETMNNNQDIIIGVKDAGPGIDPEDFPNLFTKFFTKSDKGTGLGLFICKSIVEAHGGRIWANNNKDGIGTTFSFSLPIVSKG